MHSWSRRRPERLWMAWPGGTARTCADDRGAVTKDCISVDARCFILLQTAGENEL